MTQKIDHKNIWQRQMNEISENVEKSLSIFFFLRIEDSNLNSENGSDIEGSPLRVSSPRFLPGIT